MRTDVHKPSLADPADYSFMAAFYQGSSDDMMWSYTEDMKEYDAAIAAHPVFDGNYSAKYTCDHCGAAFAHGALFLHVPSGELVHIGHICASNTIGLPSKAATAKKKAEKHSAEMSKKRARTEAFIAEGYGDVVEFLAKKKAQALEGAKVHPFVMDMIRDMAKWGGLFPKQAEAMRKFAANDDKFADKDAEREARIAKEKEEEALADPVSAGRQDITGKVLKTEWKEYGFGYQATSRKVMYLRGVDGNRYWGTVPSNILETEAGDIVSFTATVTPADDDPHMGFYKRPTGGTVNGA